MNKCCDPLTPKSTKELHDMYLAKMRSTKQKNVEENMKSSLCDKCNNGAQECCECDYFHIYFLHNKYPENKEITEFFKTVSKATKKMIDEQESDEEDYNEEVIDDEN